MNEFIKYYQKEYEARRISRREFAGRLGAAGVAATAATSLLTASDSVLADTPVKGGRMRIGWYTHSANDTLNPNRLTTTLDYLRESRSAARSFATRRIRRRRRTWPPSGTRRTT